VHQIMPQSDMGWIKFVRDFDEKQYSSWWYGIFFFLKPAAANIVWCGLWCYTGTTAVAYVLEQPNRKPIFFVSGWGYLYGIY
jgi:hypothetical protein